MKQLDLGTDYDEVDYGFTADSGAGQWSLTDTMLNRKFFKTSLSAYFDFKTTNAKYVSNLIDLQMQQIQIIEPLGWMTSSSYLESVAMMMSEVYEAHSETDISRIEIEVIDILLRTIVLCKRLECDAHKPLNDFALENVLNHDTVIDIRLSRFLDKEKPTNDAWMLALYSKMAPMVNMLRSENLDSGFALDLVSCLNQVIYLCFLYLESLLPESSQEMFLDNVIGILKYKIERNKFELPRKNRFK